MGNVSKKLRWENEAKMYQKELPMWVTLSRQDSIVAEIVIFLRMI